VSWMRARLRLEEDTAREEWRAGGCVRASRARQGQLLSARILQWKRQVSLS
jgi:hypothetical protein